MFIRYPHLEKLGNVEVESIELGVTHVFPKPSKIRASCVVSEELFLQSNLDIPYHLKDELIRRLMHELEKQQRILFAEEKDQVNYERIFSAFIAIYSPQDIAEAISAAYNAGLEAAKEEQWEN